MKLRRQKPAGGEAWLAAEIGLKPGDIDGSKRQQLRQAYDELMPALRAALDAREGLTGTGALDDWIRRWLILGRRDDPTLISVEQRRRYLAQIRERSRRRGGSKDGQKSAWLTMSEQGWTALRLIKQQLEKERGSSVNMSEACEHAIGRYLKQPGGKKVKGVAGAGSQPAATQSLFERH